MKWKKLLAKRTKEHKKTIKTGLFNKSGKELLITEKELIQAQRKMNNEFMNPKEA